MTQHLLFLSPSYHPTSLAQMAEQDSQTSKTQTHNSTHCLCIILYTAFQEGSNVVETQYQSTAASKRNLKVLILFMKENVQQGHRFHCQIMLCVSSSPAAIIELLHYASEQDMWCYFRYPLKLSSHDSISFSCT